MMLSPMSALRDARAARNLTPIARLIDEMQALPAEFTAIDSHLPSLRMLACCDVTARDRGECCGDGAAAADREGIKAPGTINACGLWAMLNRFAHDMGGQLTRTRQQPWRDSAIP
ncbi:hypothetical protein [Azohydromonas aeria]|uniref:hypothetical protein n=1 Tax=Azohydromonas aeria TaxID=2590212 RepID=UPI0012F882F4|nr:hypothetical protein [Azohydromonas aeria]